MDRDDRLNDNLPADGPAGPGSFDNAVGAYLLDALDDAELAEFEAFLRDDLGTQADVAALRPVVGLLTLALDDRDIPQPSANLRFRILQAARDDAGGSSSGGTESGSPVVEPLRQQARPAAPIDQTARPSTGTILPFVRRMGFERLAAGLLALIAAGTIIWGISLQGRLNDTKDDLNFVRDELALAQDGDDGVVRTVAYLLDPTPDGPETANAIVELQTEGSAAAKFRALGMPATVQGRAYQLWFINLNDAGEVEGVPRPSVTFQVGDDGHVILDDVPVDGPFDAVAITNEPEGGSTAPTTSPILFGTRGVAAG